MRLDDDTLRRIFKGRVLDGRCVNRHLRDVLSKAGSADYPLRLHLTDHIEGYSTVAAVFVNAQFGVPNTAVAQLLPAAAVHVDMTERDVRDLIADRYWTSDPARFGGSWRGSSRRSPSSTCSRRLPRWPSSRLRAMIFTITCRRQDTQTKT